MKREDQAETAIGDERERVRRVDRLRGQDGQYLFAEMRGQPNSLVFGKLVGAHHVEILVDKKLAQFPPLGLLGDDQGVGFLGNGVELLGWS